jgi:hypothetical protein
MHEIQLAVLDLAGTTVKTTGGMPRAFAAGLAVIDVVKSPGTGRRGASKQIDSSRVRGDRLAGVAYVIPPPAWSTFIERRVDRWLAPKKPSASCGATVRVALNTGFDRDITSLLVGALRWDDSDVDAIVCRDDVATDHRWICSARRELDRRHGRSTGHERGTQCWICAPATTPSALGVGVLFGSVRAPQRGATYLVRSIAELSSQVLGFWFSVSRSMIRTPRSVILLCVES